MNIEDQITALLEKAAPLRCLPEQEQGELGALVDRINELRALQSKGVEMVAEVRQAVAQAQEQQAEAEFAAVVESVAPKRKGRPPKARTEGADA